MGILKIKTLIKQCGQIKNITHFRNKVVLIDTSIYLYRFIYRADTEEECTRFVLNGFLNQLKLFKKYKIVPVYIFDGIAPHKKVLEDRKKRRERTAERMQSFQEEIETHTQKIAEINGHIENLCVDDDGNLSLIELENINDDESLVDGIINEIEIDQPNDDNPNAGNVVAGNVVAPIVSTKQQRIDYETQKRQFSTLVDQKRESIHKLNKQTRKVGNT